MKNNLKKRGQKLFRRFSRLEEHVEEESKRHIKENIIDRLSHIKNIRLLILEWGLLVFALIMLGVTQAIWFKNSYSTNSFTNGGTFTEGTIGKINSLNPLFATTESEKTLSRLMFATITTVDFSGHPGLGLAKSITSTENGRIWTIELRDDLKWSDGEPLTNADIIFTTDLIQNPNIKSSYDSNLFGVKVTETEDGKVAFTLPAAYADFDSALNIPIVPKHILENTDPKLLIEDDFSTNPVTSGAFAFNATQSTSSNSEKIIYLTANPHYYKGKPTLNSFSIHAYADKAALINDINSGAITATASLTDTDAVSITSKAINQKQSSINSGVFAFLNTNSKNLKDKSFRQAIKQALDIEHIRQIATANAALDYPMLSSQINISKYPNLIARDTEAATKTFSTALSSAENQNITLSIATVKSETLLKIANEIAEELRACGLTIDVTDYEENQDFISNIIANRNYDILVYEIELGADPDLLPYYHSSQATASGLNLSNYKNTLVDDILLGARETIDETLRIARYESFLGYWASEVPAIGFYQSNLTYYYNKNVRVFSENNRLVTPLDRFADIEDWASVKEYKNRTP